MNTALNNALIKALDAATRLINAKAAAQIRENERNGIR